MTPMQRKLYRKLLALSHSLKTPLQAACLINVIGAKPNSISIPLIECYCITLLLISIIASPPSYKRANLVPCSFTSQRFQPDKPLPYIYELGKLPKFKALAVTISIVIAL